ncbi:MAG TPA: hypothetical protein VK638_29370 [Edaphobacter sp.]|nr:hypothetical protein [Edaphobacter sp.]
MRKQDTGRKPPLRLRRCLDNGLIALLMVPITLRMVGDPDSDRQESSGSVSVLGIHAYLPRTVRAAVRLGRSLYANATYQGRGQS